MSKFEAEFICNRVEWLGEGRRSVSLGRVVREGDQDAELGSLTTVVRELPGEPEFRPGHIYEVTITESDAEPPRRRRPVGPTHTAPAGPSQRR